MELAKRLFWWKSPEEALGDQNRFLVQVMAIGTWDDVILSKEYWTEDEFRLALKDAPPGVFDIRSWSYWHRTLGVLPIPSLPQRSLL